VTTSPIPTPIPLLLLLLLLPRAPRLVEAGVLETIDTSQVWASVNDRECDKSWCRVTNNKRLMPGASQGHVEDECGTG
jgi:hypothetical protein